MFYGAKNIKLRGKGIATSKSIVNTLFFITSENKNNINFKKNIVNIKTTKILFKSNNSTIGKFLNMFNWY